MRASILQQLQKSSPLLSLKKVRADAASARTKKTLHFSLNLTTLIDAFCILVIFLLSNMNSQSQQIENTDKISLPSASKTEQLEEGTLVKLEKNDIYINDKLIPEQAISKTLLEALTKNKKSLIIQADKKANFERIALVMKAGGQVGFEKFIFAVLPGT
jgi:biopolymer transport protein ExbD